jgi:hypothetical protein
MVICPQLMPADRAGVVLILRDKHHDWLAMQSCNDQNCFESNGFEGVRGRFYQPWLEAWRMEKVLARQLLHLVIHNQVFPANSTLSLTTQSSNDFFSYSYNRKICDDFL